MTPHLCAAFSTSYWSEETVNYILLLLFIIFFIINTFCAVLIVRCTRKKRNITFYFVIELLVANVLIFTSQIVNTSLRLFSSLGCVSKVCIYIVHQTGVQLAASSILSIIVLHYCMVTQLLPIDNIQRQKKLKVIVMLQAVSIILGVLFILFPLATTSLFGHSPSEFYHFVIHVASIVYCWKSKRGIKKLTESVAGTNVEHVKHESKWIIPSTLLSAVLQLFFVVTRIVFGMFGMGSRDLFVAVKWVNASYYAAILVYVIIITKFRTKTKFNCWCFQKSTSKRITTLSMRTLTDVQN